MIDRSVILRYVGFPFYGKEGVSIYTTPAPEIILVSSDALETVFINAAPAPEVIQIVVDFFTSPDAIMTPLYIKPVPVIIVQQPAGLQDAVFSYPII